MTKQESNQPSPAGKGFIRPFKSTIGALFILLLVGIGIVAGATTSSILISRNEDNSLQKGNNYSYLSSISYSGQIVAFDSISSNLDQSTPDTYNGWDIFSMDRNSDGSGDFDEDGGVNIVLITPGANGNSRYPMVSRKAGLSADQEKRYVVFQSDSTSFDVYNWTPPFDTAWSPGVHRDIFLADLSVFDSLGRIHIHPVSCSTTYMSGGLSNADSGSPGPIPISLGNTVHAGAVIYLDSSNSPFVIFESSATNLIPGGTESTHHIFLRDISKNCGVAGSMTLLSSSTSGEEANGDSTNPAVSSDGRFVAFVSYATNLVSGPDGSRAQVYLLDRNFDGSGTPRYYLLSKSVGGAVGMGDSFSPSIGETTGGKIRVTFSSDAENLVVGDTNGFRDIFLAEVTPGVDGYTLKIVSNGITGVQGNNISTAPTISGDGLVVSFTSYATNLVFNDNNYDCVDYTGQINCPDVFSRAVDLAAEFIWRTSLTTAGEESQANSGTTQLDGSGKYATFVTFADLMGTGVMDPYQQIYVRDHGNPPGNPIVSPPSWKYLGVEPGASKTQDFTLTFLGDLRIGTIAIQTDQTDYRFSIQTDTCSGGTFAQEDTCTFRVQFTARADDLLGSIHKDIVNIPLPDDPRGKLDVALEGRVAFVSYNPLVMIE